MLPNVAQSICRRKLLVINKGRYLPQSPQPTGWVHVADNHLPGYQSNLRVSRRLANSRSRGKLGNECIDTVSINWKLLTS